VKNLLYKIYEENFNLLSFVSIIFLHIQANCVLFVIVVFVFMCLFKVIVMVVFICLFKVIIVIMFIFMCLFKVKVIIIIINL
jgi:hypothetical protein